MARPRKSQQQAPGAPFNTQGGGYIERPLAEIDNGIRALDTERACLVQAQQYLTNGMTRAGTAGGVRAGRTSTTGQPAGANMAGGLSGPDWLRNLMRQHTGWLSLAEVREIATQQGRKVYGTFPSDVINKHRKEFEKRGRGTKAMYRLKAIVGGTGKMARGGEPSVGRQKKAPGRAMTMNAVA